MWLNDVDLKDRHFIRFFFNLGPITNTFRFLRIALFYLQCNENLVNDMKGRYTEGFIITNP